MNLSDLRRICDEAKDNMGEMTETFRDAFEDPELVGHLLDCAEAECNCSLDECWGDCPQLLAKHRLDAYLKESGA